MDDPDEVCQRVGRRIGELREQEKLTQRAVAEAAGIEVAAFQRIENAGENLTLRMMVRIATAFDVPVVALFEPAKTRAKKRSRGRPKKAASAAPRKASTPR